MLGIPLSCIYLLCIHLWMDVCFFPWLQGSKGWSLGWTRADETIRPSKKEESRPGLSCLALPLSSPPLPPLPSALCFVRFSASLSSKHGRPSFRNPFSLRKSILSSGKDERLQQGRIQVHLPPCVSRELTCILSFLPSGASQIKRSPKNVQENLKKARAEVKAAEKAFVPPIHSSPPLPSPQLCFTPSAPFPVLSCHFGFLSTVPRQASSNGL